jgi:hypothetical protein
MVWRRITTGPLSKENSPSQKHLQTFESFCSNSTLVDKNCTLESQFYLEMLKFWKYYILHITLNQTKWAPFEPLNP